MLSSALNSYYLPLFIHPKKLSKGKKTLTQMVTDAEHKYKHMNGLSTLLLIARD